MTRARVLPSLILLLASALGAWAFLAPFFAVEPRGAATMGMAHAEDAPLLFLILLGLCVLVIIASLETRQTSAPFIAVLGILVGINATLRLIPSVAGLSTVFFLPILCGYVFGANFGFLLGALSLLLSALITSGIGPWLPFQMFAAGWTGMVSGWLPRVPRQPRIELALLCAWGGVSGFLYGAIMNLWFWPFLIDPTEAASTWQPGIGVWNTLVRYALFYVTTSLWWDAARAFGNVMFLLLVGAPILRLLRRLYARFHFTAFD